MTTIYLNRSVVAPIVNATFPGYKGKRVNVRVTPSIHLSGTNWDGGARSQYRLLRLEDNTTHPIPQATFMERSALHESSVPIPEGFVVVELHQWGNHDSLTIHTPSANITPTLSAPIELTRNERIVLEATRSLKSSYGGISNYRYEERGRAYMTPMEWESTKLSLVGKGMLDKRGAITIAGRNAIA